MSFLAQEARVGARRAKPVVRKLLYISTAFLLGLGMGLARADGPAAGDKAPSLGDAIKAEIASSYPGAKIEIFGPIHWLKGPVPQENGKVTFIGENGRGEAQIQVRGVVDDMMVTAEGMIGFTATVPAYIAKKRITPGEKIDPKSFEKKDVDVSRGQGRELRGVIFPQADSLTGLESRQTILEGQFLTSTAVQKTPDIKRGDIVNIRVISGGLIVDVQGQAEESAYLGGQVRVMAMKSKRELVGFLKPGSLVEVNL
jgi:flagella basal body P-ring formation protein FlgA